MPSMLGIMWSKKTISNLFFFISSIVSLPEEHVTGFIPKIFMKFAATFKFMPLSSVTSTFASGAKICVSSLWEASAFFLFSSYLPTGVSSTTLSFRSKPNVEPIAYLLSTSSLLFIMARSLQTIEIPRPVPSIWRLRFSSIRLKDSKSLPRSSSLIPIPVSATSKRSLTSPSVAPLFLTRRVTLPVSVYLTALVRRFNTI